MPSTTDASTTDFSPGYKRFALLMLTVVYTFNFIDRQLLVILQEPIKADMNLSDAQLGLLSGFSFALIYVTAGIPIAYIADRNNRRNIITYSLAVWSGMTALSGFAQNYWQLLMARIGVGLGEAGGSPPAHAMISDYYPPHQRGTALSIYSSGIYIGILFGFLFGGMLAQTLGWRTTFLVMGVPGILFALLFRFTVKEPLRGQFDSQSHKKAPSFSATWQLLKTKPSFWYISLGCAFTAYASYGNGNFFPSFLIRNHGFSLAEAGATLALASGVAGAIGTFLGGYLGDKLAVRDKRWYLWIPMIAGIIALGPYVFLLLSDNPTVVVCLLFGANILGAMYFGPSLALGQSLVPPSMRALSSAVLFFILNMIGLGLGPLMTGLQSDWLGPQFGDQSLRYSMIITAMSNIVAIIMFALAARRLLRDLPKD